MITAPIVEAISSSSLNSPNLTPVTTDATTDSAAAPLEETILLRIQHGETFFTVRMPYTMFIADVLRELTQKCGVNYDEYTLHSQDESNLEMDRTLKFYLETEKMAELHLVPGPKTYHIMCISECDKETLVLKSSVDGYIVMAGNREHLIQRATDLEEKDMTYVDTLLLTFRSFMEPLEFFDHLIACFNAQPPPNPTPEDEEFFNKHIGVTQMRVVGIMLWWTNNHWHDFAQNSDLKNDLEEFVRMLDVCGEHFKNQATRFHRIIEVQTEREERIQMLHRSIESKRKTMESMFEELDIQDLAKQMCLHDFELFTNIHPIEFLVHIWKKKNDENRVTPNLDFFNLRFDRESFWVATEILSVKDLKKRAKTLQKFVQLAKECQELCNFFSTFAITFGLSLTPVQRLKKTWELLPQKSLQQFKELDKLCDPSRNMRSYRTILLQSQPPILPFVRTSYT